MKIHIITDMEGVAGVLDITGWAERGGSRLSEGRALATLELNSAVEGFLRADPDAAIHVFDGHGIGGLDPALIHPRATLLSKSNCPGPYPLWLNSTYDAIAWVGQHAMSGTPFAHLPHTGEMAVLAFRVNGVPVGEFAQMALCAAECGVTPIFCSGDLAMSAEAVAFAPGIETVSVKRGLTPGRGDECSAEEYRDRNTAAEHLDPAEARRLISEGASRALRRFAADRGSFTIPRLPQPPYTKEIEYRPRAGRPVFTARAEDAQSVAGLLNKPAK